MVLDKIVLEGIVSWEELAAFIKKFDSDLPLLIGGPHCSVIKEKVMLDFPADVSVMGDAEFRIPLIVQDEIRQLAEEAYRTFQIMDDNFLVNKNRAEKVMDFIIRNEFDFDIWIDGARVDSADRGFYEKMRDAGVALINFGLESGNQDVLDFYHKKITLDQIRKAVELSIEMGFFITGTFILGAYYA